MKKNVLKILFTAILSVSLTSVASANRNNIPVPPPQLDEEILVACDTFEHLIGAPELCTGDLFRIGESYLLTLPQEQIPGGAISIGNYPQAMFFLQSEGLTMDEAATELSNAPVYQLVPQEPAPSTEI